VPLLPEPIHERLRSEFAIAAARVADAGDLNGKIYYFSTFFGEPGRQLNNYWNADLALLHNTVQYACQAIPALLGQLPAVAIPPIDQYLRAIDQVSADLLAAFQGPEVDMPRFYAAVARVAELTYMAGGNGAYLYQKGMIPL
jgi:hypothetical protein